MENLDILTMLQRDIHSAVFATLDDTGLPQTCVIDVMLADSGGLYFLTARGKSFYDRLMKRPFVAISGMKGTDTLSTVAISVRGAVRNIGQERLAETRNTGYQINAGLCTGCQKCLEVCPQNCISLAAPPTINESRCLHCGNCYSICPVKAVEKLK